MLVPHSWVFPTCGLSVMVDEVAAEKKAPIEITNIHFHSIEPYYRPVLGSNFVSQPGGNGPNSEFLSDIFHPIFHYHTVQLCKNQYPAVSVQIRDSLSTSSY